ncbi:ATP synthase subunit I [Biformimicrobium ophioploci]|uniref:ATP synthase subunit I n=1 Tax=Biformimicrobium ophioploci TaxID=3036711 RepID=UPI00255381E9|nr:ATP synthase subunit I [Microbulbifer sp. NKW57]
MKKSPVLRIALVQLLLTLAAALALLAFDTVAARSVLLGGLLCAVPNAYFGFYAFRHSGARNTREVLKGFQRGEAGKFALTLAGFAAVFATVRPLNALLLFIAFGVCTLLQWLLAARFTR